MGASFSKRHKLPAKQLAQQCEKLPSHGDGKRPVPALPRGQGLDTASAYLRMQRLVGNRITGRFAREKSENEFRVPQSDTGSGKHTISQPVTPNLLRRATTYRVRSAEIAASPQLSSIAQGSGSL
ncbi:MAG: hypothetical protein KDE34_19905, partial [Anaerolineales bacterium]|nr:hypothetical protein [Anaerolineales bacterium]